MHSKAGILLVRAWERHVSNPATDVYDETLREVASRAAERQYLSKADIGSLVLWKRITAQSTWATRLQVMPDREVARITGDAYAHTHNLALSIPQAGQAARYALWHLPGMRGTGALSSALLLAMNPDRMAVWDRRVAAALVALGCHPRRGTDFYARYLHVTLDLAERMHAANPDRSFVPRDVDVSLYTLAADKNLLDAARQPGGLDNPYAGLSADHVEDLEDRQVQGDDHRADQSTHERDHQGLDE